MIRHIAISGLLATALMLAGCGFHLRGTGSAQLALKSISVTATNAHGDMQRTLERALKEGGVKLLPSGQAPYSIRLISDRRTRRSVATSSDVTVSEYGLQLQVKFAVFDASGKQVIGPTTVSTERIYQFDNNSLVGNTEQEKLLNKEMRRDLAEQIIRRVDATIRARANKHA